MPLSVPESPGSRTKSIRQKHDFILRNLTDPDSSSRLSRCGRPAWRSCPASPPRRRNSAAPLFPQGKHIEQRQEVFVGRDGQVRIFPEVLVMDECVAIARQDQLLHRLVELDGPVEGRVLPIPQLPAFCASAPPGTGRDSHRAFRGWATRRDTVRCRRRTGRSSRRSLRRPGRISGRNPPETAS